MVFSEIVVSILAISVNVVSLLYFAEYYQTTKLTLLFHTIVTNPYPYWSVELVPRKNYPSTFNKIEGLRFARREQYKLAQPAQAVLSALFELNAGINARKARARVKPALTASLAAPATINAEAGRAFSLVMARGHAPMQKLGMVHVHAMRGLLVQAANSVMSRPTMAMALSITTVRAFATRVITEQVALSALLAILTTGQVAVRWFKP